MMDLHFFGVAHATDKSLVFFWKVSKIWKMAFDAGGLPGKLAD